MASSTLRAVVPSTSSAVSAVSVVDPDLLRTARTHGPDHPDVVEGVGAALTELAGAGAEQVVCTCSTIGATAESVGRRLGIPVARVDRAMAERAVGLGERIVVLAASESTLAPTRELLVAVAAARGVDVEIELRLVDGAWERFEGGDPDGYHRLVAEAVDRVADGADVVVLAQASMAPAAARVRARVPVLTSPRPAVEAILGL